MLVIVTSATRDIPYGTPVGEDIPYPSAYYILHVQFYPLVSAPNPSTRTGHATLSGPSRRSGSPSRPLCKVKVAEWYKGRMVLHVKYERGGRRSLL